VQAQAASHAYRSLANPCVRITLEITGRRKRAKPAVAGPVHRRVGRHPWTTSRSDIFHEGGNLHELDARAHTVETGYPLE
jgi:hypothetical protein